LKSIALMMPSPNSSCISSSRHLGEDNLFSHVESAHAGLARLSRDGFASPKGGRYAAIVGGVISRAADRLPTRGPSAQTMQGRPIRKHRQGRSPGPQTCYQRSYVWQQPRSEAAHTACRCKRTATAARKLTCVMVSAARALGIDPTSLSMPSPLEFCAEHLVVHVRSSDRVTAD
jgi:hypothetical protein